MRKSVLLLDLLVNAVLPWLIYDQLSYLGEQPALLWSAVPPLLWSGVELLWHRRLDAIAIVSLLGIALSLAMLALGGSPRWLLVRESLVTGLIGVSFLLTLALRRPILYHLARATLARQGEEPLKRFEAAAEQPGLLRAMRILTLGWGCGMVLETLLRSTLAWTWPIERYLVVSPILFYGSFAAMTAWTVWYRRRLRERAA